MVQEGPEFQTRKLNFKFTLSADPITLLPCIEHLRNTTYIHRILGLPIDQIINKCSLEIERKLKCSSDLSVSSLLEVLAATRFTYPAVASTRMRL